jgi:hypothetical protein
LLRSELSAIDVQQSNLPFTETACAKRVELTAARRQNAYSAACFAAQQSVRSSVHYRTPHDNPLLRNTLTAEYQSIAPANAAKHAGITEKKSPRPQSAEQTLHTHAVLAFIHH